MNKKLRNGLALCLAVLMLATVLAGCGGSGGIVHGVFACHRKMKARHA